jgi:hypothetical protein
MKKPEMKQHVHKLYISQVFEFANLPDFIIAIISCNDASCDFRRHSVGMELESDD